MKIKKMSDFFSYKQFLIHYLNLLLNFTRENTVKWRQNGAETE